MVWDKSGTAKEVESLKKRFPKRGIDPTIPAEIRQTLRDREQEKEMTMGEKNRYARGGNVKSSSVAPAKMMTVQPTSAPPLVKVPPPETIQVPTPMSVPTPMPIKVPTPMKVPPSVTPKPVVSPPPPPPNIPNKRFTPSGRADIKREYASGGSVSSASSRGDGCAQRGRTNCKYV